jgi:hypothetical protein
MLSKVKPASLSAVSLLEWKRQSPEMESICDYTLNRQPSNDKGRPSAWEICEGVKSPWPQKAGMSQNVTHSLVLGQILQVTLSPRKKFLRTGVKFPDPLSDQSVHIRVYFLSSTRDCQTYNGEHFRHIRST